MVEGLKEKFSNQKFFLEKIVWHIGCSFANPAEQKSAKNEAESIKIRRRHKNAQFSIE